MSDEKLIEEMAAALRGRNTDTWEDAARAALAVVRRHEGWRLLEEERPNGHYLLTARRSDGKGWIVPSVSLVFPKGLTNWKKTVTPTHWHRLPKPPA